MDERVESETGAATLTEVLQERIRQDIILGTLEPGAKLRLERLSKAYGASVSTLRETTLADLVRSAAQPALPAGAILPTLEIGRPQTMTTGA